MSTGKVVRIYDGVSSKYFDADNTEGVAAGEYYANATLSLDAFDSLKPGEILVLGFNGGKNGAAGRAFMGSNRTIGAAASAFNIALPTPATELVDVHPVVVDGDKYYITGTILEDAQAVASAPFIIYNFGYQGALISNSHGEALVIKDGKTVRVYDGANGKYYDADNASGVVDATKCTAAGYLTEAFASLTEGEWLLVAPNDATAGNVARGFLLDHRAIGKDVSIYRVVNTEKVTYSADASLWANSTGATFTDGQMDMASGQFTLSTNKLTDNLAIDFTTTESLSMDPVGDWKWEYLTISTSGGSGIDAASGMPQANGSITLVWGWTTGLSLVERDAAGNVIYNKKAAKTESETTFLPGNAGDNADTENIINQTPYNTFNKAFRVKINVTQVENGTKFDIEIITKSPWGHDVDWTISYTSTNKYLSETKYLTYGRIGSGTVDADHKILVSLDITTSLAE